MKNLFLLLLSFISLCSLVCYADSPCDNEMRTQTPQTVCQQPTQQTIYERECPQECFLCTNKNIDELFDCMGLNETQICTAMKIQDKYELEVLSLNEKIQCEEDRICALKQNCANKREIRAVKKNIKEMKKKRKEICKCYEKQFKAILSDNQKREYRRFK